MRGIPLFVLLLTTGCAAISRLGGPPPSPALTVADDGRSAAAGGETWTAPEEIAFYQRGNVLRVVSSAPGRSFDVAVPLGADGRLAWPADAPFVAANGALAYRTAAATPEIARLIESGQLYPHDDHFHLTHKLQDEDWQALYRDREDGSPMAPLQRQAVATILALLVDQRIPGTSAEATEGALRRIRSIIGKVRRAVDAGVSARALETILTYDVEIRDDGRTVEIAGQRFQAAEPIRFEYCAGHIHVVDGGGKWAQLVELEGQTPGAFAWPRSMFFEARPDATIAERTSASRWRALSDSGQVRFTRDHWHVTEAYANPRLQRILKAIDDPKIDPPLRDKARALALELMRSRLDTGSDAEFESRLAAIDQLMDRAGAEFEKELRANPNQAPRK